VISGQYRRSNVRVARATARDRYGARALPRAPGNPCSPAARVSLRPDGEPLRPVLKLADERGYWSVVAHHKHPITAQNYANYPGMPETIRVTREVTQPPVLVHTDSGWP
jgi:hypothetical protein